jgi:hypothetical protein
LDLLTPSFTITLSYNQLQQLPPFLFSSLTSFTTGELHWAFSHVHPPFITSGRTEYKLPPPAVPLLLCAYPLLRKRLAIRCPATDVLPLLIAYLLDCVYRAVAQQWSYALQYHQFKNQRQVNQRIPYYIGPLRSREILSEPRDLTLENCNLLADYLLVYMMFRTNSDCFPKQR